MGAIDITGQTFGRLTVLARSGIRNRKAMWLCRCQCGTERTFQGADIRSGRTKSCGCITRDRSTTHGRYGSREHRSWANMLARCRNPKSHAFSNYGGRGITVCDRWRKFENFYADMGPMPSARHTIERKNNDGNYEPGNCVWATNAEQSNNRRTNRTLTYRGRTQNIGAWSREIGIDYSALYQRVAAGWSTKRALETPAKQRG